MVDCIRTLPASKPGPTEIEPYLTTIFSSGDFSDLDFLATFQPPGEIVQTSKKQ